jgi:hypothetical protein
MIEVIGYSYEADLHCVDCAKKRFGHEDDNAKHGKYVPSEVDENYVRYDAMDNEGNPVHPIFSTDELSPNGSHCGDCGCLIKPGFQA